MSFDLVMWRGTPEASAEIVYARLTAGEPVGGLQAFAFDEVRKAFTAACRGEVEVEAHVISGRGFSVPVEDGALYLPVTCDWSFAGDARAQKPIRDAARRLDATVFDPQTASAPPLAAVPVAAAVTWGTCRVFDPGVPTERACSVRGAMLSIVPPDRGPLLDQVHELFVHQAGVGIARGHSAHVANLTNTTYEYARLASPLPFEIIVACGRGTARDASGVGLPNRLFAVVDGELGGLRAPFSTFTKDESGNTITRWTAIGLFPVGRAHDLRGGEIDLTEPTAVAARNALALAQAGDTLPLRDLDRRRRPRGDRARSARSVCRWRRDEDLGAARVRRDDRRSAAPRSRPRCVRVDADRDRPARTRTRIPAAIR